MSTGNKEKIKKALDEAAASIYYDNFKKNDLNDEDMALLSPQQIEELIPKMGPRLRFIKAMGLLNGSRPSRPRKRKRLYINRSSSRSRSRELYDNEDVNDNNRSRSHSRALYNNEDVNDKDNRDNRDRGRYGDASKYNRYKSYDHYNGHNERRHYGYKSYDHYNGHNGYNGSGDNRDSSDIYNDAGVYDRYHGYDGHSRYEDRGGRGRGYGRSGYKYGRRKYKRGGSGGKYNNSYYNDRGDNDGNGNVFISPKYNSNESFNDDGNVYDQLNYGNVSAGSGGVAVGHGNTGNIDNTTNNSTNISHAFLDFLRIKPQNEQDYIKLRLVYSHGNRLILTPKDLYNIMVKYSIDDILVMLFSNVSINNQILKCKQIIISYKEKISSFEKILREKDVMYRERLSFLMEDMDNITMKDLMSLMITFTKADNKALIYRFFSQFEMNYIYHIHPEEFKYLDNNYNEGELKQHLNIIDQALRKLLGWLGMNTNVDLRSVYLKYLVKKNNLN